MPTLICDLRPTAANWAAEYEQLRVAGEALLLFWPCAQSAVGVVTIASAASLDAAFENEQIACLTGSSLPAWLPLDDFHRVVLRSDAAGRASLSPQEAALVRGLYAGGAERVELWNDTAAESLMQSWHSGRRSGSIVV